MGHDERRKLMISKDLMMVWREHTWNSVRRRIGIQRLHSLFHKRQRLALARWVHTVAIQNLASHLRKEYDKTLIECKNDIIGQITLKNTNLQAACNKLSENIEVLRSETCSNAKLQE